VGNQYYILFYIKTKNKKEEISKVIHNEKLMNYQFD